MQHAGDSGWCRPRPTLGALDRYDHHRSEDDMTDTAKHPAVEVEKLSLIDIGRASTRLTLASALWLAGLLAAYGTAALSLGRRVEARERADSLTVLTAQIDSMRIALRKADSLRSADDAFKDWFGRSLADPRVLSAIADGFARERPDGVKSREDLARLVGWQLLGQRGEASFYRADSVFRVHLQRDSDGTSLRWESEESVLADAGRRLGLRFDPEAYERMNSSLNRGILAPLSPTHSAVRTPDGGIAIVGSSRP